MHRKFMRAERAATELQEALDDINETAGILPLQMLQLRGIRKRLNEIIPYGQTAEDLTNRFLQVTGRNLTAYIRDSRSPRLSQERRMLAWLLNRNCGMETREIAFYMKRSSDQVRYWLRDVKPDREPYANLIKSVADRAS